MKRKWNKKFNDEKLAQEKYEESKEQITGGLELIKENDSKYEEDNFGSFGGKEIIEEKNEKKLEIEEETDNKHYDISGFSILVVEDNSVNMYLVTELLSLHNVKVTQAWNGKEAVDIFSSNPAGTFDVILMDLQMPVMDGIEAAKTIRKLERQDATHIPIIALSANVYTEDVAASSAAGMNGHLSKPINFDTLCKTVYNAVKK